MKRDRLPHGSKNDFCMILAKHGAYEKVPIWSLNGCSGPIGAGRSGGVSRLSQKKYPVDTSGHGEAQKTHQNASKLKKYHNTILARQAMCFFAPSSITQARASGGGVPQRFTWQKALFTVQES